MGATLLITVIDGPDGAGKTSLARALTGRYGGVVRHHGTYARLADPSVRYLASLAPWQLIGGRVHRRTLDRSWIAEPIYGRAMRDGVDRVGTANRRMLERIALSLRGVTVIALPPFETCLAAWRDRKGNEYLPDDVRMRAVYEEYRRLTSDGPCDLPLLVWNREGNVSLDLFLETIEASRPERNQGPGIGHWAPDETVLMVGDQPGPGARGVTARRLIFCDFDRGGCSAWLACQLETYGVPESRLYWINARTKSGRATSPRFLDELRPLRIVALGEVASAWCRNAGLRFYEEVPHPSYWKRFHYHEPYPLEEVIRDVYTGF